SQNSAPPRSLISGGVCTQLDVFKSNASIDCNLRYCSSVNNSIPIAFTISTTVFFGGYFFLASSACRSYKHFYGASVFLYNNHRKHTHFSLHHIQQHLVLHRFPPFCEVPIIYRY